MRKWLLLFGCLLAACARQPDDVGVRAVERLIELNHLPEALNSVEDQLRTQPQSPRLQELRLVVLLKSENFERATAVLPVGPRAVEVMSQLLRDDDQVVRGGAARLVVERGITLTCREWKSAVNDSNPVVRRYAAAALGNRADCSPLKLEFRLLNDDNWYVRAEAAAALGKLNEPRAAGGWLVPMLDDSDGFVRYNVRLALRSLACEANHRELSEAFAQATPRRRLGLSVALAKLNDPVGFTTLTNALTSTSPEIRRRAIEALADLPALQVGNLLEGVLVDPDVTVRKQAEESLKKFRAGKP